MAFKRHTGYLNVRMLLRVIGWLLLIETAFMTIPFATGLIYREESAFMFLVCMGITATCGISMVSLHPKSREMGKREAIVLTGLIWVILSLFGMLPFLMCGTHLGVTDAFLRR